MQRPTIALCMIVKNEAHNMGQLLQSVKGCFDEIHITDTGSTDRTLQFINGINEQIDQGAHVWAGVPRIQVHHFEWVGDFARARNASFIPATSDYIMWLDADDVLSDAAGFIRWRDNVMHSAHYWLAVYNYGFRADGAVDCKFMRERVIKRGHGFGWEYPVHEGIIQKEGRKFWPQRVSSWCVNHKRT
jgi:glycosyltransferase involved in cell wall biosynthesis